MAEKDKAEPFVKWAGGKRSVLDQILPAVPEEFGSYFEPFIGGGAVFFALAERAHGGTLGDINEELLQTYQVIRDKPEELLVRLEAHRKKHYAWLRKNRKELDKKLQSLGISYEEYKSLQRKKGAKLKKGIEELRKAGRTKLTEKRWSETFPASRITKAEKEKIYYYQVRSESPTDPVDVAARFIYLNRTCFNGLYRVNSSGQFNVPLGDYDAPDIVRKKNILAASKALKKIDTICNEDFSKITPRRGDFVYLDPPYDIIRADTFTQYAEDDFDRHDQARLRDFLQKLDSEGVLWMTSNHDTPFIRRLYRRYNIYQIEVGRSINSDGSSRGTVREVLVTNYRPPQEPRLRDGTVALLGPDDLEAARAALQKEAKGASGELRSLLLREAG